MPRIEMALVPEVSMLTPGVKRTRSWKSLMPLLIHAMSWVSAVTLMGTLLRDSSCRVAVTTISSRPPEAAGAAAALPVSARIGLGGHGAAGAQGADAQDEGEKQQLDGRNSAGSGFERMAGITSP